MLFPEAEETRLLSNIIKWSHINFDQKDKHMVNSDQSEKVKEAFLGGKTLEEISGFHIKTQQELVDSLLHAQKDGSEFVSGINVINYDNIAEKDKEQIAKEAQNLLSNAKQEAQNLLEDAASKVDILKEQAYAEGKQEGYDAGILEGSAEISRREEDLIAREQQICEREKLQEDIFADRQKQLEPFFAELTVQLIEKLTGILVDDKKEIILHLMKNGIKDAGQAKHYIVHVSLEDAELVKEKKELILSELSNECEIEIVINDSFSRYQCMIETDNKLLDCDLDIQMHNLIEDLRLLSIS